MAIDYQLINPELKYKVLEFTRSGKVVSMYNGTYVLSMYNRYPHTIKDRILKIQMPNKVWKVKL